MHPEYTRSRTLTIRRMYGRVRFRTQTYHYHGAILMQKSSGYIHAVPFL